MLGSCPGKASLSWVLRDLHALLQSSPFSIVTGWGRKMISFPVLSLGASSLPWVFVFQARLPVARKGKKLGRSCKSRRGAGRIRVELWS